MGGRSSKDITSLNGTAPRIRKRTISATGHEGLARLHRAEGGLRGHAAATRPRLSLPSGEGGEGGRLTVRFPSPQVPEWTKCSSREKRKEKRVEKPFYSDSEGESGPTESADSGSLNGLCRLVLWL